jgi:hypothetical protein
MPPTPQFTCYISPHETPLSATSAVWQELLPLARPTSGGHSEIDVSHGDYFDAVRDFLKQDEFRIFAGVLARRLQQAIQPGDIREIRIHLEKHGEFYHPARIETDVAGRTIYFVLNVAISDTGKNHISREFYNLKRLNADPVGSFLPQVYTLGEVSTGRRRSFGMFLGKWFKGYHEFHISSDPADNQSKVCVWDEKIGRYYLSNRQTLLLYKQAARIMTAYYNVSTSEHISPWHHAAGDFIVKNDKNNLDLKLITVRGYVPLFQRSDSQAPDVGNGEQILQALLIFFLKLCLRMRLDRIDGIGDLVWLDPDIVQSTVQGVFEALGQKTADPNLPDAVETCFRYYLSLCSQEDLLELSGAVLRTLGAAASEIQIINQHLAEHVALLIESIRKT